MADLELRNVVKNYDQVQVVKGISLDHPRPGVRGAGRALGLRQVDHPAHDRRARGPDLGGEIRIGGRVVNDVAPKDRDIAMVFQSYALYPHLTVRENLAFGLKMRKRAAGRDRRARGRGGRACSGIETLLDRKPKAALGRPAPARRHGARHRAAAAGLPLRRAALQPRRQAARADAHRDRAPAPAPPDHHRLRHPRPDRGHDPGRPHRGHEGRA